MSRNGCLRKGGGSGFWGWGCNSSFLNLFTQEIYFGFTVLPRFFFRDSNPNLYRPSTRLGPISGGSKTIGGKFAPTLSFSRLQSYYQCIAQWVCHLEEGGGLELLRLSVPVPTKGFLLSKTTCAQASMMGVECCHVFLRVSILPVCAGGGGGWRGTSVYFFSLTNSVSAHPSVSIAHDRFPFLDPQFAS